jgi:hypothetical protein
MDDDESFDMEYSEKLCTLGVSDDPEDLDLLGHLERDSRYVCSACGRSAHSEVNLCVPEEI